MKINKNILLLSTYVLSMVPTLFYGTTSRIWLSILHGRPSTTRLDIAVTHYVIAINFFILSYCLLFPKSIDLRVRKIIFIITTLDLLHLFLNAKQNFGLIKIGLAITILVIHEYYKKNHGKI